MRGTIMWDTVQNTNGHLSRDLPCPACGHAAHIYLACSDTCDCAPRALPGADDLALAA